MADLHRRAREMNLRLPRYSRKADVIRAIQQAEGNFPCYGTAVEGLCDQVRCLWRADCLNRRE
jgi:hypothetical protein